MFDRSLKHTYSPLPQRQIKGSTESEYLEFHSPSKQQSPATISRKKLDNFELLANTPGFPKHLLADVQQNDEASERYLPVILGSVSQSEDKSQGISLQEPDDFQNHIMHNINRNLKRNFKHLLFTRLRNRIEEVRGIQGELEAALQEQRELMSTCLQEIGREVQRWARKTLGQPAGSQLMQQLMQKERTVATLEDKIKSKQQECSRLRKELEKEQEKSRMAQKTMTKKTVSHESRSSLGEGCPNCKVLEIRQSALKEEMLRSEKEINELLIDNQKLQEHIFDMEQRIVGIDLEVEKRLNEHLHSLSPQNNQDYLEIVRKLNDENQQLQEKHEKLEKSCLKEHQLKEWEQRLVELQADYRRKEASLFESLAAHEMAQQKLYEKDRELTVAEENVSAKIEALRKKEEELIAWEAMMSKSKVQQPAVSLLPSVERGLAAENILIDEMNMNSFGKIQPQLETANLRHFQSNHVYERTNSHQNVFIPHLPLKDTDPHPHPRNRIKTEFVPQDEQYSSTIHLRNYPIYSQIPRRYEERQRLQRDYSPGGQERSHRGSKFHTNIPNSPQNYRDSSKNSRVSANRSMRGVQRQAGLSNKLDRLREEIKREMDAIR